MGLGLLWYMEPTHGVMLQCTVNSAKGDLPDISAVRKRLWINLVRLVEVISYISQSDKIDFKISWEFYFTQLENSRIMGILQKTYLWPFSCHTGKRGSSVLWLIRERRIWSRIWGINCYKPKCYCRRCHYCCLRIRCISAEGVSGSETFCFRATKPFRQSYRLSGFVLMDLKLMERGRHWYARGIMNVCSTYCLSKAHSDDVSVKRAQRDRSVCYFWNRILKGNGYSDQIALYKHKLIMRKNNLLRELSWLYDSMKQKFRKNSSTDRCNACTARSAQAERRDQESTGGRKFSLT